MKVYELIQSLLKLPAGAEVRFSVQEMERERNTFTTVEHVWGPNAAGKTDVIFEILTMRRLLNEPGETGGKSTLYAVNEKGKEGF